MKLSKREKMTADAAKAVVDTIFDAMMEGLEKGERIEIRGFGALS